MIIAIDWDETFSRDINAWRYVVDVLQSWGHTVYIVTWRTESWNNSDISYLARKEVAGIYFTDGKAKRKYMKDRGINVDVWIDDYPFSVDNDCPDWTDDQTEAMTKYYAKSANN